MKFELPRLLVIADGFSEPRHCEMVMELALARALPWVQLRDHYAEASDFAKCARELTDRIREVSPSTVISVNGYPDLALELNVGLHLGFRSITPADARLKLGPDALIGYSAHSDSHIAVIAQCHYITYSPVFPVKAKPSSRPLGLERLRFMASRTDRPILALGAISPGRVADCFEAGAHGVAVLSGIMGSSDPVGAVKAYIAAIEEVARVN